MPKPSNSSRVLALPPPLGTLQERRRAGFGAAPGYGHDYSISFVAGWAAVAPPDGRTDDDTTRLQEVVETTR